MKPGRPMLAMREPPEQITYPLLGSFKLDGFRALVGDALYTRKLKIVRNNYTQRTFGRSKLLGFDGELIVGPPAGKGIFQRTSSGVTSFDGEPDVKFYVFDLWNKPDLPFQARFRELAQRVRELDDDRIEVVPHVDIPNQTALEWYEAEALSMQYEGLILRDPSGFYLNTRCGKRQPYMFKLKRFKDGEMVVTGYELEMENRNPKKKNELGLSKRSSHIANKVPKKGVVGVLLGKDTKTGQDVRVGSGMTRKQKELFFKMFKEGGMTGEIVKYKHFEQSGVKDKRRHSIFLGLRDASDL
jgi:DNA ligase-1